MGSSTGIRQRPTFLSLDLFNRNYPQFFHEYLHNRLRLDDAIPAYLENICTSLSPQDTDRKYHSHGANETKVFIIRKSRTRAQPCAKGFTNICDRSVYTPVLVCPFSVLRTALGLRRRSNRGSHFSEQPWASYGSNWTQLAEFLLILVNTAAHSSAQTENWKLGKTTHVRSRQLFACSCRIL